MLGVFAAGVIVGVAGTKWFSRESGAASPIAPHQTTVHLPGTADAAPQEPQSASPAPLSVPAASPSTPAIVAMPPVPPSEPAPGPLPTKTPPYAAPIDSGFVQPIAVGERLRKMVDRPSIPGHENEIGDAHRALEREPRDDGWAYSMESELQSSMIAEVSSGGFKVEGVDCRSTLCEVRVSGTLDQAAGVKRWQDSLMGQPFGQRLFMNYGSTSTDNERVDGIFIFRRPAQTP